MNFVAETTGANTLAGEIIAGTLARQAIMEQFLATIDANEADIRAFVHLDRAQFLAAPQCNGPLAGLPVGIKDIIDTADMPTACGSPIYQSRMPVSDSPIVSMVRRAGGVIAGKTVTTEFAAVTAGPTRNPHNLAHTPGGSSSGSAAAVAAGFLPLSIGTQTGGSVIRPAAYCGVAGLKPTIGLLPGFGIKGFSWTLDTPGLFGRTVRDVAFFAAAITGQDLAIRDGHGVAPHFGIARMPMWDEMDDAMEHAMATAREQAAQRGATISRLPVDKMFEDAYQAHYVIQDYELARSLAYEYDTMPELVSPKLRHFISNALTISPQLYARAQHQARIGRAASDRLFADCDVLLAPSASSAAPLGLENTGSPNFTRIWTLLGLPSVSVPGLVDTAGLPLGLQVIGRLGQDRETLHAAAWLENVLVSLR